jgi:uncharacterized protein (TIGR00645 family)
MTSPASPNPPRPRRGNLVERSLETLIFNARWIMAPFYLGLVASLVLRAMVFVHELVVEFLPALTSPEQAIMLVLSLIDLSLAGNLTLIVIFSGYENFVSKIDTAGSVDRPSWMGTVDFSGMKVKLIGSIVAISAISLLRAFMRLSGSSSLPEDHAPLARGAVHMAPPPDDATLRWLLILHITFVVSGVLFAVMDLIAEKAHVVSGHTPAHKPQPTIDATGPI